MVMSGAFRGWMSPAEAACCASVVMVAGSGLSVYLTWARAAVSSGGDRWMCWVVRIAAMAGWAVVRLVASRSSDWMWALSSPVMAAGRVRRLVVTARTAVA